MIIGLTLNVCFLICMNVEDVLSASLQSHKTFKNPYGGGENAVLLGDAVRRVFHVLFNYIDICKYPRYPPERPRTKPTILPTLHWLFSLTGLIP